MTLARVVFDAFGYRTEAGDTNAAEKGQVVGTGKDAKADRVVEISDEYMRRGLELGALAKVSSKDAEEAIAALDAPDPLNPSDQLPPAGTEPVPAAAEGLGETGSAVAGDDLTPEVLPPPDDGLDEKTVDELQELAAELEISGRGHMNKAELLAAVRAAQG